MVVAQPHDCNIGQTGGCDNLVQFGHEYRDQMPEFDCSAFFISFGGYLSVSRTESLSMNCSTSAKLFLNKAGIDLPSGIEEDAHYLCSDECTFACPFEGPVHTFLPLSGAILPARTETLISV